VVDHTQQFVGVDRKHNLLAQTAEAPNDLRCSISAAADGDGQRAHEPGGRRFEKIAVEPDHDRALAARFGRDEAEQRGFADAPQAVQEEDGRAVLLEQAEQLSLFGCPAQEAGASSTLADFGGDHQLTC